MCVVFTSAVRVTQSLAVFVVRVTQSLTVFVVRVSQYLAVCVVFCVSIFVLSLLVRFALLNL